MYRITWEDALTATTRLILVDLSDTTNWPHSITASPSYLVPLGWEAWMRADAAEELHVAIGLITRIDATNADIHYFATDVLEVTAAGTDRTGYRAIRDHAGRGLQMGITSDLPRQFRAYNDTFDDDDTDYQTDVDLATIEDPATLDTAPALGDIVIQLTERSGTAAFEFGMAFDYGEVRLG